MKFQFRVYNKLPVPFDSIALTMTIEAPNLGTAMAAAAKFGIKHHALLTLIE